ncbi:MAG TPA: non-heme iron oxygenase ferredoxin subunit [Stellaceae bacterium]
MRGVAASAPGAEQDGFTPVLQADELPPGRMKWVAVAGERVVLANVEGAFYALRDVCGHKNAPLSRGRLVGHLVECPLHFAQFDLRTGELANGPVSTAVPVYEVRVEAGTVYVRR